MQLHLQKLFPRYSGCVIDAGILTEAGRFVMREQQPRRAPYVELGVNS